MIKKVLIFETDYIFRKDLRQKITLCNYSDKIEVFFQDSVDNIEEVIEEEGIDELVINAALLDDISTTDFNGIKIRAYAKNLSGFKKIIERDIARGDGQSFSLDFDKKQEELNRFTEAFNLSGIYKKHLINIENKTIDEVAGEINSAVFGYYGAVTW